MGCGLHKLLVLELTAQVDMRSDLLGNLAHAGHAPVQRHARAPVQSNTPGNDKLAIVLEGLVGFIGLNVACVMLLRFVRRKEKATRNLKPRSPVSNHVGARSGAHKQLHGRKKRGFTRTSFTREHGKPTRWQQGCLLD